MKSLILLAALILGDVDDRIDHREHWQLNAAIYDTRSGRYIYIAPMNSKDYTKAACKAQAIIETMTRKPIEWHEMRLEFVCTARPWTDI